MSRYRPVTIGPLKLSGNLFLAPVAGYTDRAFRSICAGMGADFSWTELVSAEALTRNPKYYALDPETPPDAIPAGAFIVRRGAAEKHYAVQLFGAKPGVLGRAVRLLAPLRPDAVDLNAGCPVPKVTKTGAGAALMRNPANLGAAIQAMAAASTEALGGVPVTVKIRAGWDEASKNYAECAAAAVEAGAAMVSLHPRTRSQGYGGASDWSLIADLAARLPVPVSGSGDLYTPEDARRMLEETGCAAVLFARGAMGNPFIFAETKTLLTCDPGGLSLKPGPELRLQTALRHLEMLAKDLGEKTACLEMRKQFCAYTKGIAWGGKLRQRLVHAETISQYQDIAKEYLPVSG